MCTSPPCLPGQNNSTPPQPAPVPKIQDEKKESYLLNPKIFSIPIPKIPTVSYECSTSIFHPSEKEEEGKLKDIPPPSNRSLVAPFHAAADTTPMSRAVRGPPPCHLGASLHCALAAATVSDAEVRLRLGTLWATRNLNDNQK